MANSNDDGRPRQPVSEPEIILPSERIYPHRRGPEQAWVRQRVFVAPPGPLGVVLGLLVLAALVAIGFVAFLGFFLLVLPLAGALAVAVVIAALLRGSRRT